MKIAYRYPIRWAISFVCCSACYRSLDAIKSNLFKFSGNIFEYFSAIPNNRGNVECGCCLFLLSCKQNIFPSKMPIYHLFSLSIWWTMYLINGIHTHSMLVKVEMCAATESKSNNSTKNTYSHLFHMTSFSYFHMKCRRRKKKSAIQFPFECVRMRCDSILYCAYANNYFSRWKCHKWESDTKVNWKWLLCCLHK